MTISKRIALYACSTRHVGASVSQQVRLLQEYVEKHKIKECETYIDVIPEGSSERPTLQKLLLEAQTGLIEATLIVSPDVLPPLLKGQAGLLVTLDACAPPIYMVCSFIMRDYFAQLMADYDPPDCEVEFSA